MIYDVCISDTSDQYRDERESFDISMNESNQDEMALLLPVMSYQNISSPTGVMSNYASLGPLGAEGAYEKQQWDRKKDLDDLKLFLEEQVNKSLVYFIHKLNFCNAYFRFFIYSNIRLLLMAMLLGIPSIPKLFEGLFRQRDILY